jgi:hypothetical protein
MKNLSPRKQLRELANSWMQIVPTNDPTITDHMRGAKDACLVAPAWVRELQ